MATVTFDTHKFVRKLKEAGIEEKQAEAEVDALAEALNETITVRDLAAKADIDELKSEMNVRFERIDGELKLNRWMLGVLLAGVISLVLKAFF